MTPPPPDAPRRQILRNALTVSGERRDIAVSNGLIERVSRPGPTDGADDMLDLGGYLVLPSLVEPHCHFDKVYTDGLIGSPAGDVPRAMAAWYDYRTRASAEEVFERALRAARGLMACGVTALRTHMDVGSSTGLLFIETMQAVKERCAGRLDIQVAAFVDRPVTGEAGRANLDLLRQALAAGADVVGGSPYQSSDAAAFHRLGLAVAREFGRPIDFHVDETLDPSVLTVADLADAVEQAGFAHGVTASHCVSLGAQPAARAREVAHRLAAVGIAVVCLPQCNLSLQGRDTHTAVPRGLTALRPLQEAGVVVAAGGDNWQDPFNAVGRGDPFETAALMVMAGHLSPEEAFATVTAAARRMLGLPEVRIEPGFPADILAIRARSLRDAIARAPHDRMVWKGGRLVSRTDTITQYL